MACHYKSWPVDLGEHVSKDRGYFIDATNFIEGVFEIGIVGIKTIEMIHAIERDVIKKMNQCC
jgi:hypothetical protein